jgi:hypothetical protein
MLPLDTKNISFSLLKLLMKNMIWVKLRRVF